MPDLYQDGFWLSAGVEIPKPKSKSLVQGFFPQLMMFFVTCCSQQLCTQPGWGVSRVSTHCLSPWVLLRSLSPSSVLCCRAGLTPQPPLHFSTVQAQPPDPTLSCRSGRPQRWTGPSWKPRLSRTPRISWNSWNPRAEGQRCFRAPLRLQRGADGAKPCPQRPHPLQQDLLQRAGPLRPQHGQVPLQRARHLLLLLPPHGLPVGRQGQPLQEGQGRDLHLRPVPEQQRGPSQRLCPAAPQLRGRGLAPGVREWGQKWGLCWQPQWFHFHGLPPVPWPRQLLKCRGCCTEKRRRWLNPRRVLGHWRYSYNVFTRKLSFARAMIAKGVPFLLWNHWHHTSASMEPRVRSYLCSCFPVEASAQNQIPLLPCHEKLSTWLNLHLNLKARRQKLVAFKYDILNFPFLAT